MYEFLSVAVGLTFWAIVGLLAYRTYRALARRLPALDHAVNNRVRAIRAALSPRPSTAALGVTYLWTVGNHHARYRRATTAGDTSEATRYLDAA